MADVERKRKQEEYLKEIREDATDVLHEDMQEMTVPPERDDDETDIIIAPHPNKKAAVEALKERQNSRKAPKQIHSDVGADSESATDVLRGDDAEEDKTTDILRDVKVQQSVSYSKYEASDDDSESATDVLRPDDDSESATDVLRGDDDSESATDVLRSDDADEATDVLREESDEEATDVLREESDEEATDVLREKSDESTDILQNRRIASSVKIIKNVIVVHSNEKI